MQLRAGQHYISWPKLSRFLRRDENLDFYLSIDLRLANSTNRETSWTELSSLTARKPIIYIRYTLELEPFLAFITIRTSFELVSKLYLDISFSHRYLIPTKLGHGRLSY